MTDHSGGDYVEEKRGRPRKITRRFSFESGPISTKGTSKYEEIIKAMASSEAQPQPQISGDAPTHVQVQERPGRQRNRRGRSKTRKKSKTRSRIGRLLFRRRHSLDSRLEDDAKPSSGRYTKKQRKPRRMSLPSSLPTQSNVGHTAKGVMHKLVVGPAMRIVHSSGRNRSKTPETRNDKSGDRNKRVAAVPLGGMESSLDFHVSNK